MWSTEKCTVLTSNICGRYPQFNLSGDIMKIIPLTGCLSHEVTNRNVAARTSIKQITRERIRMNILRKTLLNEEELNKFNFLTI